MENNLSKLAILVLADGTIFHGQSIGVKGSTVGEVVFNTSMTGYQEILTDPSYAHQIITLTYPHIGNVGTNNFDNESNKIHAHGLIIKDMSIIPSNYRCTQKLSDYLKKNNVIAISNIDTRKLTRILRIKGSQNGCILATDKIDVEIANKKNKLFAGLDGMDLAQLVSTKKSYTWNYQIDPNKKRKFLYNVVAYDFGIKRSILNILNKKNCFLTIVPAKTTANEVLKLSPDGIFLSNGPGDPRTCYYAISAIKTFLQHNIPMFGICLGYQLLALAIGSKIIKMKFGHHGANHPVKDIKKNKVIITTQNHNFAVDHLTLPKSANITHISLFDNTLQGLHHKNKLAFGFQGHPESNPGPHDAIYLFDHFIHLMKNNMNKKNITGKQS
ncbi:glutamine-hydrolyzing carbamoyl-phosphate synthase small subunit [Buchnera aphidicola]|uniref:glutamine-hydrolyzing carbamoyl-phosphate synthase small subunit n=1 Tax=Buchnera aphidicola TaxID=9 RepID=UPI0031B8AA2D